MKKTPLTQFSIFFLTYDEPLKMERWSRVRELAPEAQWINGVKGFDEAHKVCARLSKTRRFVVIDGDNFLFENFQKEKIPESLEASPYVLSWSSLNSINGLQYGNGGVKCWDREVALGMKTHERSERPEATTDFCFEVPYYQFSRTLSRSEIHLTPFQAFRAGFREGVKMAMIDGKPVSAENFRRGLPVFTSDPNFARLTAWMTLGADVENGLWALLGARQGFFMSLTEEGVSDKIKDHDWLSAFWSEVVAPRHQGAERVCPVTGYEWSPKKVVATVENYGRHLFEETDLRLPLYTPSLSANLKKELVSPRREGLMFDA